MPTNSSNSYETEAEALQWLGAPINSYKIKYGEKQPRQYSFKSGNYAEIYRGDTFMRYAPFVMKTDIESDNSWAQFTTDGFYGKNPSMWPWDWPSIQIIWMPMDKSDNFCDKIGGGGYKIKVDEGAKCQLPIRINLEPGERLKMLMNNRMVGQGLLLKAQLNKYEKPQTNWMFWGILALGVLAIVALWALWQTGLLNGAFAWVGNLGKGLSIPGAQTGGGTAVQ